MDDNLKKLSLSLRILFFCSNLKKIPNVMNNANQSETKLTNKQVTDILLKKSKKLKKQHKISVKKLEELKTKIEELIHPCEQPKSKVKKNNL